MSYTQDQYDQVLGLISEHHGKADPISSREINEVVGLDSIGSFPNTRKCIRDIMFAEKIPIVGGNEGYFIAETEEEISDALDTLDGRILGNAERKMALIRAAQSWGDLERDGDYDVL